MEILIKEGVRAFLIGEALMLASDPGWKLRELAAACGADALGFIFYPPSPRYISPEKAREIIARLPPEVVKVGVFVNHDAKEVERIRQYCGLDLIQLHGDETPDYCRRFVSSLLIKALSPQNDADLYVLDRYEVRAVLVDACDKKRYGGTGLTTDRELAVKVKKTIPSFFPGA